MATTKEELASTDFLDIYSVACRVRDEISKCNGIDINPLNVEDLQLSTAKMLLPETLYWLIRWIITGEQNSEPSFSSSASTSADEQKILMTAQDLVHCASHARIKLPKHIGLGMSVKHLTGSKQLVNSPK